jgi:hypothetical protein
MASKRDKLECLNHLRQLLNPGDTVYTKLIHVSRSGMYRVIDLYVIKDNQPIRISGYASDLLGGYDSKWEGCKASGCGMDMGFHLVYGLGYHLFPDGFGIKSQPCGLYPEGITPGTKEHAELLRSKGVRFYGRNRDESGWDNDGGYALNQRWL